MAAPPGVKKISSDDLSGDWSQDSTKLLSRLNSFLSDSGTIFQGGVGLTSNAGCQKIQFTVQTPDPWVTPTLSGAWTAFPGQTPQYRITNDGAVVGRGAAHNGVITTTLWTMPSALWPFVDANLPTESNGAYGKLTVLSSNGTVNAAVGSNVFFSLSSLSYYPSIPVPYVASCWPRLVACTLPGGQAAKLDLGPIVDVTAGSSALAFTPLGLSWHNAKGQISVDNIPGLLPNRTYSVTLYAWPVEQ